jgi:hypothetical protein
MCIPLVRMTAATFLVPSGERRAATISTQLLPLRLLYPTDMRDVTITTTCVAGQQT